MYSREFIAVIDDLRKVTTKLEDYVCGFPYKMKFDT